MKLSRVYNDLGVILVGFQDGIEDPVIILSHMKEEQECAEKSASMFLEYSAQCLSHSVTYRIHLFYTCLQLRANSW